MSLEKLPEGVIHEPIEGLVLSTRAHNALKRRGVNFVGQLLQLSDEELLSFLWLGRESLQNIKQALQAFLQNWSDAPSAPTIPPEELEVVGKIGEDDSARAASGGWLIPEPVRGKLSAPVLKLDLSARARTVLRRLKIETVEQLLSFPKHKLLKAQNFGRKSLAEVQVKLFEYLSGKGPAHSLAQSTEARTREFVDHLLSVLTEGRRGVVQDRYGLWDGSAETLQDIGDKMGLTRERIRQIEASALRRIRRICDRATIERFIRIRMERYLEDNEQVKCGVLSEDETLDALAQDCSDDQALCALAFLQDIWPQEDNVLAGCLCEVEEGVFCLEKKANRDYREVLQLVERFLEQRQKPLRQGLLFSDLSAQLECLAVPNASELLKRVLAISPSLALLQDGTVALSRWSEFGRRNTTALVEAALRVIRGPAHFTDIASKIVELFPKLEVPGENAVRSALNRRQDKFVWVRTAPMDLRPGGCRNRLSLKIASSSCFPRFDIRFPSGTSSRECLRYATVRKRRSG